LAERGLSTGVGDEGGFAPNLARNEEACAFMVEAIERAGYVPGDHISLALDPAASSFWIDGAYDLTKSRGGRVDSKYLQSLYVDWVDRYPIVSIEDGFAEHDWVGFREQCSELGSRIQIVGDDLYVTNRKLIERGIQEKATNAVLIKLNQIGTVTETIEAIDACRSAGWSYVVSHRSGETDDPFIADFAVAMGGGQIKAGAPCRGERVAKYNRLLEIENELGDRGVYSRPFRNTKAAPSSGETLSLARMRAQMRRMVSEMSAPREIVAVIEESASLRPCMDAASRAAAIDEGISLIALHICADPALMVAGAEEVELQQLRGLQEGSARERLDTVYRAFETWRIASKHPDAGWREHTGDVEGSLPPEIRNALLIVLAEPHNLDSADALHAAIFDSKRPVLYVPANAQGGGPLGRHMAIAWKPRPQARRAIIHMLPWLRAAQHITAISVNEPDASYDTSELVQLLNAELLAPDIKHVQTGPREHVADRILFEAEKIGADSLVMGAYRFGQMFEWVFGGVTRDVLRKSRVPVFMMH
jgi:nucleotide-binding universal stress UspA family protein